MISVVVPVYNEADNIWPLQENLREALDKLRLDYEIIYVDDGSVDRTFENLKEMHKKSRKTKVIKLARNRGKTIALQAGFDNAEGDVIITIDGDLQNDARDIELLMKKIDDGFDVVSGWRYSRKDAFFGKRVPSLLSNLLARILTGVKLHDFGCPLKAYKRNAIKSIRMYGDVHRYLPALIAPQGYRIAEVKVRHYKRKHGKSKYGIVRLLKGPLDLLYIKFWSTYSTRPLHFFGFIGIIFALIGTIIGILNIAYHIYITKSVFINIGPILLLTVLLTLVGAQFIAMGFISEILVSNYYAAHDKKAYRAEILLKKKG